MIALILVPCLLIGIALAVTLRRALCSGPRLEELYDPDALPLSEEARQILEANGIDPYEPTDQEGCS